MRRVHGKLVRETIEEVLAPEACALLIVDMQNDAVSSSGSLAQSGIDISEIQRILPGCQNMIAAARGMNVLVVHVKNIALPNGRSDSPSWIRTKGLVIAGAEAFIDGTWGAEIVEECRPIDNELIVEKHRSSAFVGTNLDALLGANGIETVVIIGEQTPGCVEATYRDAAYHDYYNVLVEDCVAAFDRSQHEASLLVQRARHDVCTSEQVLSIWRSARSRNSVDGS